MNIPSFYPTLALLVLLAVVLDIVTGFVQAKANRNLNSKKASSGIWKKISIFAALLFGFFLDYLCDFITRVAQEHFALSFSFSLPIGLIVGLYIIVCESISIFENLYLAGVKLPAPILKALKIAQGKLDKKDQEEP